VNTEITKNWSPHGISLYQVVLGDQWSALPAKLQYHFSHRPGVWKGTFHVRRRESGIGRWLGTLCGAPPAGEAVPVRLEIQALEGMEVWRRSFAGKELVSWDSAYPPFLVERFGPVEFRLDLHWEKDRLWFRPAAVALRGGFLRFPLPRFLSPRLTAWARAEGAVHIFVSVSFPGVGFLFSYEGMVEEAAT
jgi:hypothetical protein